MIMLAFAQSRCFSLHSSPRNASTSCRFAFLARYPLLRPIHCHLTPHIGNLQGGDHYDLSPKNRLAWTVLLTYQFNFKHVECPVEGQFSMTLKLAYRGGSAEYVGGKSRDQVVQLTFGALRTNLSLSEPFSVMLRSDELVKKLFKESEWPSAEVIMGSEHADGMEELSFTLRLHKVVANKNNVACYLQDRSDKQEDTWVIQANFAIVKNLAIYNFTDGKTSPFYKILARQLLDERGEGTVYMSDEMSDRSISTRGFKWLDVEVIVSSLALSTKRDVTVCFGKQYAGLITGVMEPDTLFSFILSNPKPPVEQCISYFGRQPNNEVFVAGNCCIVKGGHFTTLEEQGVSIIANQFEEAIISVPRSDYPRHIIIELPHVRYWIATRLWNDVIPEMFLNNTLQARAVLAFSVMGLHASKIWAGQSGLGHGCPFMWVYSSEPNTGKTEAALLAHAMTGGFHRAMWGGDVSKPAMYEKFSQQRDIAICIDDVVLPNNAESKAFKQMGRGVYDRMTRAVSGKTRTPQSTVIFTSNQLCNEDDAAFQSRQLLIKFDALNNNLASDDIPDIFTEWTAIRELSSCLMPDFESILGDGGKLDSAAIGDCALFLQEFIGAKRDRSANVYAILMYYMLLLNFVLQSDAQTQRDTIEFVCGLVKRSNAAAASKAGILDRFLAAIDKLRVNGSTGNANPLGPVEKTIFWDKLMYKKYREGGHSWMSLRVPQCAAVIETAFGEKFSSTMLNEAINASARCVRGTAYFADITKSGWPLTRQVFDQVTNSTQIIPLEEDAVPYDWLKAYPCVHVRLEGEEMFTSAQQADMLSIKIESKNLNWGSYHFIDAVTGADDSTWFGYRAALNSTFSHFAATDLLLIGTPAEERVPRSEICQLQQKFLEDIYNSLQLRNTFGYDFIDVETLNPCLLACPFQLRSGRDQAKFDPVSITKLLNEEIDVDDLLGVISQPDTDTDILSDDDMNHVDDSQQAGQISPHLSDEGVGSTPLGDRNMGSQYEPRGETTGISKRKRRRIIEDDDENEAPSQAHLAHPYLEFPNRVMGK